MLKTLYVKDYVLIDEIKISFGAGLNIITGETGAGKSILVDALGAILGESLSKESIRGGATKAIFEGQFEIKNYPAVKELLRNNDIDDLESTLIIRRELNDTGRSRAFINDTPVSMPVLTELGDLLVDLHGQHEHQLLLKTSSHIDYLDAFAGTLPMVNDIRQAFNSLKEKQKQIAELNERQALANQTRDLLQFQLNEINAVNPEEGEDEALQQDEKILRNAELLFEKSNALYQQLYEKEGAVAANLRAAEKELAELALIDKRFEANLKELESARIIVDEISISLQSYAGTITFDADRLENIRQRLALLNGLKKKYGGSLAGVLAHRQKVEDELALLENLQESISELESQLETNREELGRLCHSVSQKRHAAAVELADKVTAELAHLGMIKAEFKVLSEIHPGENSQYVLINGKKVAVHGKGIDHIEFLIRSNPGESFKPMVNVASGGEISRIMLALKTLLAESDNVPVLIFDEIDAGVSGRVAQAVGFSLRKLARSHQLVCITHLPQIASMAHFHYLVEKTVDDSHTQTHIQQLAENQRQEQIARLFGGEKVTDAHLQSAAELIQEANLLAEH